jgi:deoxycytidine triphosphate deaminase
MLLLSEDQLRAHLGVDPPSEYLAIQGFDPQLLHSTFYYFRIGRHYKSFDMSGRTSEASKTAIVIAPHSRLVVKSMERFIFSSRIMALFGQISEFAERGLVLMHSPFVDPLFNGHLDIGILNPTEFEIELQVGERVGKMSFFDVSEIGRPTAPKPSLKEKLDARREFADDDPVPPYDGTEPYKYDWRKF